MLAKNDKASHRRPVGNIPYLVAGVLSFLRRKAAGSHAEAHFTVVQVLHRIGDGHLVPKGSGCRVIVKFGMNDMAARCDADDSFF